jgi:hypothetical protein
MIEKDLSKLGKHQFHTNHFAPHYAADDVKTFTVSIFKWVFTRDESKLKESAAIVRIKGSPKNYTAMYEKAAEICALLDKGEYIGTKNISVL